MEEFNRTDQRVVKCAIGYLLGLVTPWNGKFYMRNIVVVRMIPGR